MFLGRGCFYLIRLCVGGGVGGFSTSSSNTSVLIFCLFLPSNNTPSLLPYFVRTFKFQTLEFWGRNTRLYHWGERRRFNLREPGSKIGSFCLFKKIGEIVFSGTGRERKGRMWTTSKKIILLWTEWGEEGDSQNLKRGTELLKRKV